MATNKYFSQGARSEQVLYEDLIVESLKMYGQDVYYLPRDSVNQDTIFGDETSAVFDDAYKIEMYIENVEGFDGEGDLFTKFGVEIRDQATFVVSRRRWLQQVAPYEHEQDTNNFFRPREGDLIFLPLSGSIFEIQKTFDETPFYQLKNLPVFRLSCELFEFSGENFDTNIAEIDNVEIFGHQYQMTFTEVFTTEFFGENGAFEVGERVRQIQGEGDSQIYIYADVVEYDASVSSARILSITNISTSDGLFHSFNTVDSVIGLESNAVGIPTIVSEKEMNQNQNDIFETVADGILDFSESNPFGYP